MWNEAWPVLLGFALTTVIGGLFASWLQQRSWRHQNEMRLHELDIDRASAVCHSLSGLMDKRWYRMQRLLWASVAYRKGQLARNILDARLRDYDQVLLEWNDELNVRLAVVGAYFGADLRAFLDGTVYEAFRDAGQSLEALYQAAVNQQAGELDPAEIDTTQTKVNILNNISYALGFTMMVRIRDGRVGGSAPNKLPESPLRTDR